MTYAIAAVFSPVATSATDVFEIVAPVTPTNGRVRQVAVTSIRISGSATANTNAVVKAFKNAIADTGTSTVVNAVPYDTFDNPPIASGKSYAANPTVGTRGTGGGLIGVFQVPLSVPAGVGAGVQDILETNYSFQQVDINRKMGVILQPGESLAINLNSASIAGISLSITAICEDLP